MHNILDRDCGHNTIESKDKLENKEKRQAVCFTASMHIHSLNAFSFPSSGSA